MTVHSHQEIIDSIKAEFPHVVDVREDSYYGNNRYLDTQLQLITWLTSNGLENHRDYKSLYNEKNGVCYRRFFFKDPNKAMIFKLSWVN